MNDRFFQDYSRYSNSKTGIRRMISIIRNKVLLGIFFERLSNGSTGWLSEQFRKIGDRILGKRGIEIGLKNVGGGFCMIHASNITINSRATIGEHFTIFKGATIGSIRSGARQGAPHIGNRVTICSNAFVCGNITIGDDVLIAANAFVNFDVPSNSVVIGNPGQIHHKNNPSADYLKNI